MGEFQTLLAVVCGISVLGAVSDGKEKQKGFIALFVVSAVLFLVSWSMTN